MLFLKHCPDITYQKLCQLLSACIHMLVCLWVCLRGAEGVRNLANCCIIFGTAAPSLQRASLKSVGSLHPTPPHPPLPAQTLGVKPSMAQLGSLTAANAAAQNLLDLWPVHGPAPTAPHYPQMAGPLAGNRRRWCSASVLRGFRPPLESSDQTLPQVCMFMFVQQMKFL